jgi:hypothetical protein
MRIIGGKDYYDGCLAYGIDPNITFVRNQSEDIEEEDFYISSYKSPFRFLKTNKKDEFLESEKVGETFKKVNFIPKKIFTSYKDLIKNYPFFEKDKYLYGKNTFDIFFNQKISDKDRQKAAELGIVNAILVQHDRWKTNTPNYWEVNTDLLGEVGMAKILSPFEIYQEIGRWIDSSINPLKQPNIVKITDDKIKAYKHGFNDMSFRKEPTKRKQK